MGYIPTLRWDLEHVVRDDFMLQIPAGFPPGDYLLRARLTVCNIPQMLPCADTQDLVATDEQGRSEIGRGADPGADPRAVMANLALL